MFLMSDNIPVFSVVPPPTKQILVSPSRSVVDIMYNASWMIFCFTFQTFSTFRKESWAIVVTLLWVLVLVNYLLRSISQTLSNVFPLNLENLCTIKRGSHNRKAGNHEIFSLELCPFLDLDIAVDLSHYQRYPLPTWSTCSLSNWELIVKWQVILK